jgi:hypothetical protein
VKPLEFLPASRSNLNQLLGALQFTLVGVEFRAGGDEPGFRFSQLWTEDLRQGLPAPHGLAKFCQHSRHPAGHQRSNCHLFVRVCLNDAWQAQHRRAAAR